MIRRTFVGPALLASVMVVLLGGCGHKTPTRPARPAGVVLAQDEGQTTGTMAFPSTGYESIIRFELPPGMHEPVRVSLQAGSEGAVEVTVYEDSPLDMPGQPLYRFTRAVAHDDVSNGTDARWLTEEIDGSHRVSGCVWVGLRKAAGTPTLWTTRAKSDQAYVRDTEPGRAMGMLPVRRRPMVRLEIAR